MLNNPINLLVAFLLELVALFAFGFWGWYVGDGIFKILLAIALPVLGAVIWGVFGTVGDSRGQPGSKPPVAVAGPVRLAIEVGIFILATLAFLAAGATLAGIIFGVVALVQRLVSYQRVMWLLRH